VLVAPLALQFFYVYVELIDVICCIAVCRSGWYHAVLSDFC
jgi:hypothetical protein